MRLINSSNMTQCYYVNNNILVTAVKYTDVVIYVLYSLRVLYLKCINKYFKIQTQVDTFL